MNQETTTKMGRKPVADKKIPVTIYRPKSEIAEVGGIIECRKILNQSFTNHLNKPNNEQQHNQVD